MIPLFTCACDTCGHRWEARKEYKQPTDTCPQCGSDFTRTLLTAKIKKPEKSPYDALDRVIPDGKKIQSFANDRRKKGRS